MSLQTRLEALVAAIGADVKALQAASGGGGGTPSERAGPPHYNWVPIPGNLYFPNSGANTTMTPTVGRLYYLPFTVARQVNINTWSFEVTTTASGTLRSGIYASRTDGTPATGQNAVPGAKLVDATGTISTSTTGFKTFTPASAVTLDPTKLYWAGVVAQTAAAALRQRNAADPYTPDQSATPSIAVLSCYYQGSVTGTLPATASTGLSAIAGPVLSMSFSETP